MVGGFRPDHLTRFEAFRNLYTWYANHLPAAGDQMHFDPPTFAVPHRPMRELVELDRSAELAIDADEQVAVERRCDAERVVVSDEQPFGRLDEIDAKQHSVAYLDAGTDVLQKGTRARRIEVPDVGAKKGDERPTRSLSSGVAEPRIVRRLMRHDAQVANGSDVLCRNRQRARGYIDEMHIHHVAARRCGLQKRAQLLAVAGTKLD